MDPLPPDLRDCLRGIPSIGVITGAGVSVESGIRSYRGQGGLYDDPEEGERNAEALSGPVLRRDPDRTWRVVAEMARASAGAKPNAGHEALVRLEQGVERFVLLTQNVDGLHAAAGSRNIIDIHGDIRTTRCMSCDALARLTPELLRALEVAPRCAHCDGVLRPDIVLFGEYLPPAKYARIQAELVEDPPDLLLAAGTTALFPYICHPVIAVAEVDHITVEVNPEPTVLTDVVGWSLRGSAGQLLPAIADAVLGVA
ncbi:MAG: NAD-dependent deacetylase [Planctomycetota bacterium]